jgi:CRP-like cAMP-binding protein
VPEATVDLLRSVPFFRPLGLTILEDLSASLGTRDVPAGEAVVCQGEPGDRFYIVESGRLETVIDARAVRELGPGDSFGEIALLREVPRTATVRAVTPARMATLDRDDFLGAIGTHVESQLGAESVVRMRVDGDGRRA